MNIQVLIDSVVRQTTVLIAQLATSGGVRAALAHIANQVFVQLSSELENQGLSRKVTADMFGMSLRTYRRKIQRLKESLTDRGRSLWEAILDFLEELSVATRGEILDRFHRDEENVVRGILRDMVESQLAFCSGSSVTRYVLDKGAIDVFIIYLSRIDKSPEFPAKAKYHEPHEGCFYTDSRPIGTRSFAPAALDTA